MEFFREYLGEYCSDDSAETMEARVIDMHRSQAALVVTVSLFPRARSAASTWLMWERWSRSIRRRMAPSDKPSFLASAEFPVFSDCIALYRAILAVTSAGSVTTGRPRTTEGRGISRRTAMYPLNAAIRQSCAWAIASDSSAASVSASGKSSKDTRTGPPRCFARFTGHAQR